LQRFHEKFEDADLFSHYAVRSTDIDLGHHMNNVAYVRLLLDCFSAKELASGNIQSVELHYSTPCSVECVTAVRAYVALAARLRPRAHREFVHQVRVPLRTCSETTLHNVELF